jgi:hypothetical protein
MLLALHLSLAALPRAMLPRRAVVISAGWLGALGPLAAQADFPLAAYCIPGVTADRCRGVFWETGKLYRKEDRLGPVADVEEYRAALGSLAAMRKSLAERLRDSPAEMGIAAADARIYLRKTGALVCRALDEERRYDSEFQLNEAMAALDEVDREALVSNEPGVAPAFRRSSLLLERALRNIDAFLAALPDQPTVVL